MSIERWQAMGSGSGGGEKPSSGKPESPEEALAGELVTPPLEIGQFVRAPNLIFDEANPAVESGWQIAYVEEPQSADDERMYVLTKPFAGKSSVTQLVRESQLRTWNP